MILRQIRRGRGLARWGFLATCLAVPVVLMSVAASSRRQEIDIVRLRQTALRSRVLYLFYDQPSCGFGRDVQLAAWNRLADAARRSPSAVASLLRDPDPEVRSACAIALARAAAPGAVERIASLLADPDPVVHFSAAGALWERGDGRAAGTFLEGLKSTNARRRALAVTVLGAVGDDDAVNLLRVLVMRAAQRHRPPAALLAAIDNLAVPGRKPDVVGAGYSGSALKGVDLRGRWFYQVGMDGCDLRGADMRGAILVGGPLLRCDLRGADLRGAVLDLASVRGSDLRGADLRGAVFGLVHFQGRNRVEGADLRGADLSGVTGHVSLAGTAQDASTLLPPGRRGHSGRMR